MRKSRRCVDGFCLLPMYVEYLGRRDGRRIERGEKGRGRGAAREERPNRLGRINSIGLTAVAC